MGIVVKWRALLHLKMAGWCSDWSVAVGPGAPDLFFKENPKNPGGFVKSPNFYILAVN